MCCLCLHLTVKKKLFNQIQFTRFKREGDYTMKAPEDLNQIVVRSWMMRADLTKHLAH